MRNFLLYSTIVLVLFSCNTDSHKVDVADVAKVSVPDITINRLEQDVFKLDTTHITDATKMLIAKYGNFYKSYYTGVLNNGGIHDTSYSSKLKRFITDKDMREAYTNCEKIYPDVDDLKKEFTQTFKFFKHYFPNKPLPKVVTMMSGFNYSIITLDSTIAIGLEMYLGSNNKFYPMLALPRYKTMFMNKENILPDATRGWMMNEFPYMMNKNDFLSEILYMGKIMYLTDALLPDVEDTLKNQYTKKQLEYCKQNEFNMWSYFIAQKTLYTTNQTEVMKFTSDGPFTTAFSKNSPPRVGYWIGTEIIKQYMKNNTMTTMEELMKEPDAQKILSKSKYKPKRK